MHFGPIAIVGQACTLPEAHSPAALWANVLAGRDCLSTAPEGRWRLARAQAMGTVEAWADRTWSDVGGYVRGFEGLFDPTGFALPAEEVRALDPLFQWALHGGREALRAIGHEGASARAGLVMGNLSFPATDMVRFAESTWLAAQGADFAGGQARHERPHPRNRFSSGLPAHLAARALGLGAGGFALDAACASSLYAIKLACDRLHDRSADVMVAGAVNRADDLFIHIGFCALSAMSRTGRSRPFDRAADGLVPAEGAGFVVLQRLEDAVAAGRKILGVIRGVGLSNDGRGRGLLAPSEEGQERAMRLAYAGAGLTPADIGLVECHATGTPVGDATELRSMAKVFAGSRDVPIGSLKSNLGHLITAAGVAGMIKVLAAMEHGTRPKTLHVATPIAALEGTPFRLLQESEPWTGPRRAALSAFGFGGNNAHVIVEAWDGKAPSAAQGQVPATSREPVAIVGIGARVADGDGAPDFARALLLGEAHLGARSTVSVALDGLKFPPKDLGQALAQQTMMLEAAREAALGRTLPRDRTMVLVGMGVDPEVARYGARWRIGGWAREWAERSGGQVDPAWLTRAQDAFLPTLEAPGVVGTMPNIPANRVNGQLDVAGPSFTVSAEEASGVRALELAARALRAGEIDAALVGAVDLSCEPVHQAALSALGRTRVTGDAAVALVLKRLSDARRDGDPVLAILGQAQAAEGRALPSAPSTALGVSGTAAAALSPVQPPGSTPSRGARGAGHEPVTFGDAPGAIDLSRQFGVPHAANGLLHVAAAALALRHGARLHPDRKPMPWLGPRAAAVDVSVLEAPAARVSLSGADVAPWLGEAPPRLHVFSGETKAAALEALDAGRESSGGTARLVIVAATPEELATRRDLARRCLSGAGPLPEGVAFRETPLAGELAFVFTGAAAAYPGMGRELALAFPELVGALAARSDELGAATDWLYGAGDGTPKHPLDQLWGTSFLTQLHAELSRRVLGLTPAATLGYSSGESNALFAMGAWTDLDAMVRECREGPIFTKELVGEFAAPARAWARLGTTSAKWATVSVSATVAEVQAALAGEPLAHLTIVNAPDDCVIGGEAAACARVVARLGGERAMALGYELAAHCPEIEEIRDAWWRLHHRATRAVPGVRFYSAGAASAFQPTADAAADAITGQALRTLDFPRMVEKAWADGVRVFVEHGPRGLCSGWIKKILGEREHLAIALDAPGRSGVRQAMNAAAWLVAAGVKADAQALVERLAAAAPSPRPKGAQLSFPAHPPPPRLPPLAGGTQVMARAPWLPPVLEGAVAVGVTRAGVAAAVVGAGASDPGRRLDTVKDAGQRTATKTNGKVPTADSSGAGPGQLHEGPEGREASSAHPAQATAVSLGGQRPLSPAPDFLPAASPPAAPQRAAAFPTTARGAASRSVGLFAGRPAVVAARLTSAPRSEAALVGRSFRVASSLTRSAPPVHATSATPIGASRAVPSSPTPVGSMNDALARLAAHQAQLAAVHRDFLANQAELHQQFLALRQATEEGLLRAYGSAADGLVGGAPMSAPLPPGGEAERPLLDPARGERLSPVQVQPASLETGPRPASQLDGALPHPVQAQPLDGARGVLGRDPSSAPSTEPVPSHAEGLRAARGDRAGAVQPQPPAPLDTARVERSAAAAALPGPKFSRQQLEVLASGKISSVFGASFAGQDGYARQVRMPEPPLLLADRVTGIDAAPGSMVLGTIWTETDVRADSWYLNDEGKMPAGVMIEAGQADLLLISWLGVDAHNQGDRVYRLLGCELTYQGGLPVAGDTLQYEIHVDGHAQQGDVRLFFFHYDCKVRGETRLTVRNGQAGFFTDEELANSAGVLWDCATEKFTDGPLDPPAVTCTRRRFSRDQLRAFAAGRPFECFGPGWEFTRTHVRSPRITSNRMQFLDEVTEFDPKGGPWGRGYLRAETPVTPKDWFFDGHFKNDPCMPGTLMFEGCLQAMSIYLAGLGFTVEKDAWRFEPVTDAKYPMRCRGQVTPSSKHLVYEVFVSEVIAGPIPTVYADLLCTVDGRKAFHAKRVGLRLVPDWPLATWKQLAPHQDQLTGALVPVKSLGGLKGYVEPKPVATVDGFAFDYESLLACAWGAPSKAFGPFYLPFDGSRRVARLPGPPYHFMSRITQLDGPLGGMKTGTTVEVEYDVPAKQWYFEENGAPTMPFCVIMEAALQPCGWLASYVGSARTSDVDLLFRNLDGTGTLHQEILPASGLFTTRVTLTNISQSAGMIIESFKVECSCEGKKLFTMNTVFGFFPKEAFENQVGLPVTDEERARLAAPSDYLVDLTTRPAKYCGGELRLAGPMLLMLDRVTAHAPTGGKAGLGYFRGEKTVSVDEWFFKAHFFQDPVQPGSLGIEALSQLLQFAMLEKGMGAGIEHPHFEPLMVERPITWKYRGQVVPKNKVINSEIQITEIGEDSKGRFAIAEGWLYVDGKRIYSAKNLGIRIVAGPAPTKPTGRDPAEESLDPVTKDGWLLDHCPTWTLPALPMMSMVDRLVGAAQTEAKRPVGALRNVQVLRWLPFPDGPVRLRTEVTGEGDERAVSLLAWREAADGALSRFEPVATARAVLGPAGAPPAPFPALTDLTEVADPYASGALFHGPAFHYLTSLRVGATGSSATLVAEKGAVPRGTLHQGLLDATTHAIPHDELYRWSKEIPRDQVAYPYRILSFSTFAPLPDAGELRLETRFVGFDGDPRFPMLDVQLSSGSQVVLSMRLVEVLLPKGPLGQAPRGARRAFLRDRRYVEGVALSGFDGTTTTLSDDVVRQSDWLPGTVSRVYGVPAPRRAALTEEVAVREHVARRAFVHPSTVTPEADGARAAMRPLRLHSLTKRRDGNVVTVADLARPVQDLTQVRLYWRQRFGVGAWPVEDLYYGLVDRFVGDVVLADPDAFARIRGRSCLYLGNHQVGVESLLFSMLTSALSRVPTVTLAKAEHRTSWLGTLIAHSFSYPGVVDPGVIRFFERDDKESLLKIVGELGAELQSGAKSVMVHVEGTRSLACRQPVVKMSSAFIDMALAAKAPIVPVRLAGGLPVVPLEKRLEFPVGYGKQDYWIGRPILPEELATLPLKERKDVVIAAINGLGPPLASEEPMAPSPKFGAGAEAWSARTGASAEDGVLFTTLAAAESLGDEARRVVDGARAGELKVGDDARGQWLGRLAQRLYGPRGPKVVGLREPPGA